LNISKASGNRKFDSLVVDKSFIFLKNARAFIVFYRLLLGLWCKGSTASRQSGPGTCSIQEAPILEYAEGKSYSAIRKNFYRFLLLFIMNRRPA
jgi:hypothetical protein